MLCKTNIRHQSDWSKVSLYSAPSLFSKNQLAKESPDSVGPLVIPTLAPTLDNPSSMIGLVSVQSIVILIGTGSQTEQ